MWHFLQWCSFELVCRFYLRVPCSKLGEIILLQIHAVSGARFSFWWYIVLRSKHWSQKCRTCIWSRCLRTWRPSFYLFLNQQYSVALNHGAISPKFKILFCLFFRKLSLSTNCIEKIANLNGLSKCKIFIKVFIQVVLLSHQTFF